MTRARPALTLLVVAIALAATLGHICVLPGHTHAAPVAESHDHDAAAHDHHDVPADAVHAASCDVLRPATIVPAPPVLAAMVMLVVPTRSARALVHRAIDTPPPTASPPLYLAHRALLI
jgi:hypothetical protein